METAAPVEAMPRILGLSGGELELMLIAVVMLILFGADKNSPFLRGLEEAIKRFWRACRGSGREIGESLGAGLGKPVADALTHSNQTWEIQDPPALRLRQIRKQMKNRFIVWIAQGFAVGRIPFAAGTFGSMVGLLWFVLLLLPGSPWFYVGGSVAGIFLSVWLCGAAEEVLHQTDPPSVVLDEIMAMPVCFAVWVGRFFFANGSLPAPLYFFERHTWPMTVGVFVAFRLFDVAKPWPVRQSQKLPGGWGVTADDVLAALYVNLLAALALLLPAGR